MIISILLSLFSLSALSADFYENGLIKNVELLFLRKVFLRFVKVSQQEVCSAPFSPPVEQTPK